METSPTITRIWGRSLYAPGHPAAAQGWSMAPPRASGPGDGLCPSISIIQSNALKIPTNIALKIRPSIRALTQPSLPSSPFLPSLPFPKPSHPQFRGWSVACQPVWLASEVSLSLKPALHPPLLHLSVLFWW